MEYYRICIICKNGEMTLRDYTFSQVCAMLKGVNDCDAFWNKKETVTSNGNRIFCDKSFKMMFMLQEFNYEMDKTNPISLNIDKIISIKQHYEKGCIVDYGKQYYHVDSELGELHASINNYKKGL